MDNEITESAKAVQEVAKATGKGIETVDKIGTFFSRVMKEPIESTCGMLSDTLKYKRWERQIKLVEKAESLIESKGIGDNMRPIKPKLALPLFQAASLEDEEELHDIWARLLVTALDPDCKEPRTVFIDIIRQLEPVDVKVLNVIYDNWMKKRKKEKSYLRRVMKASVVSSKKKISKEEMNKTLKKNVILLNKKRPPTHYPFKQWEIVDAVRIDDILYRNSMDNLLRQRLAKSYIVDEYIETEIDGNHSGFDITIDKGYDEVCITDLGVSFVQACLK